MYAELKLTLKKPVTATVALARLKQIIGTNEITLKQAAAGSPIPEVEQFGLVAERIALRATIIYAQSGDDIIVANILARSILELREECTRIARQLSGEPFIIKKTTASILLDMNGTYTDILVGEEISLAKRWQLALFDKFLAKFIPAALTAMGATQWLAGTSAVTSAKIGLVAAVTGALVEALVAAGTGPNWKWKESA